MAGRFNNDHFRILGVIGMFCLISLNLYSSIMRVVVNIQHSMRTTFKIPDQYLDRKAIEAKAAEEPSIYTSLSTPGVKGQYNFEKRRNEAKSLLDSTCNDLKTQADNPNMTRVNIPEGGSIYVYSHNDIVSSSVASIGQWEFNFRNKILQALQKHAEKLKLQKQDIILLDIGANVGAISLPTAMLGYSVIAFEALKSNSQLISRSLCENPSVRDRFTLFTVALGEKDATCVTFSGNDNIGDGIMSCDPNYKVGPGYSIRERTKVVRLDDYLDDPSVCQRIGAAKIDVEGFAPPILLGGMEVLIRAKIPIIFAEHPLYLWNAGNALQFIRLMLDGGYVVPKSLAHYRAGMFFDKVHSVARFNEESIMFVYHPKT